MPHKQNLDRPCPPLRFLFLVCLIVGTDALAFCAGVGLYQAGKSCLAKIHATEVSRAQ